ncbi:unnamed protein product [Cladocopium goreaui]|uniref:Nudix hydrolase 8 n=1 Tax=Cladocopium goreaui TaxID=2562237 RepID=A0A9P1G8I8_9DINO|nr:unnamed protein product [Cladocopium goreaui]
MEPSVRLVVAKQAEVIARMALALQRQNQNVDQLFNALATEQGVVSWPDFRSLFQQWEPSLGEDDLQGLWRSFDKDGDGSVTREEFVSALAPATQAAAAHTEDVCKRVASMLFQNGRTVTQLFDALSAGQEQVAFEDFRSLFQQLEPSLTLPDLQALWRCFDKDGDGGVTRQEFLKAMAPSAKLVVQKVTDVCGQVTQLLQQQGKSVEQLFDALAENQVVRWEAFCAFFQGVSSSLSEPDLHGLWHSFDKDGDGTVSREEFVQALGFAAPAAPAVPSGASELTDALWQAIAEVATLRAAAVGPRGSAALQDAIRQQLAAFDITRTGFLDPSTFSKAMRSYSPALPDPVVEVLRGQVCQADGKVQIDQLVTKILQPPEPPAPRASPAPPKPPSEAGGPLWSALRRIRPALHERSLRLPTVFQRAAALIAVLLGLHSLSFIPQVSSRNALNGLATWFTAFGALPSMAVTEGFEDYNKIAVKKAKEIPAPGDAAGDGPSEAASVIGGAGLIIVLALFVFGVGLVAGKRDPNTRDGKQI